MASSRASLTVPTLLEGFSQEFLQTCGLQTAKTRTVWFKSPEQQHGVVEGVKVGSFACIRSGRRKRPLQRRRVVLCCCTAEEVGEKYEEVEEYKSGYLVKEFGWGVRRMAEVGEEMRRVAYVQAEAFHVPMALFDDIFFEFFKAEVLSALIYKIKNSPPERYACLVAESVKGADSPWKAVDELVGVADVTVQRDDDVLEHLRTEEEYLYVSGIAVLTNFRRQKVATALLKACDELSTAWGFNYLALRAYEDDAAARTLYSKAGYRVVSRDPFWVTWIGKKIRVLMVKQSPFAKFHAESIT